MIISVVFCLLLDKGIKKNFLMRGVLHHKMIDVEDTFLSIYIYIFKKSTIGIVAYCKFQVLFMHTEHICVCSEIRESLCTY